MKKFAKLLSALLCVAMLIGMLPMVVSAEGETEQTTTSYGKITSLDQLESGKQYIIVAKNGDAKVVMTNAHNGAKFGHDTTVTITDDVIAHNDSLVWTFTVSNSGNSSYRNLTLLNGEKYITSDSSNFVLTEITTESQPVSSFTISAGNEDGTFHITANDSGRLLMYYPGKYFGNYAYTDLTSKAGELEIYKVGHDPETNVVKSVVYEKVDAVSAGSADYVIAVPYDDGYKALSYIPDSGKLHAEDVAVENGFVKGTNVPAWTITNSDGSITLAMANDNTKFISSANSANITIANTSASLPLVDSGNGHYHIKIYDDTTDDSKDRYLVYRDMNGTTECNYFGAYQTGNLDKEGDAYYCEFEFYKLHEHSYTGEVTKEPTVTAEGEKTYTCSACGASYTEPIAQLIKYTGHNVRLQDLIKIGYYFEINPGAEVQKVGALIWTKEDYESDADHTVTSTLAKNTTATESEGTYTVETEGIYAQYLDTVYVAIAYYETAEGYVYSTADDFSVLDYAEYVYNQTDAQWDDTKSIIVDLLNYATAARTYFGYTENIAAPAQPFNAILSAADQVVAWDDELLCEDPATTANGEFAAGYQGRNVNLLEAISIGLYFDGTDVQGVSYWTADAYAEGAEKTGEAVLQLNTTYVKASVTGIYSYNIYDDYYMRAYNSEGRLSDTYAMSVAGYLSALVELYGESAEAEDQALVALAQAMLVYGWNARTNTAISR